MTPLQLPLTIDYAGACPRCRQITPPLREISATYFGAGGVECSGCAHHFDLWEATLDHVIGLTGFASSLSALGPKVTHLRFRVPANQVAELDFTKYGISEGAAILFITYSPNDNSLPLEWHGNAPPRRFRGTKVLLYGVQTKTSEGVLCEEQLSGENVSVSVLWAPKEDSTPWVYLVDAIEAVSVGRYSQAIVPAHAAAEISITPIVSAMLQKYSAKRDVERLLKQELSFASILNVVIPLICASLRAKPIPDRIRDKLNELRKLRNEFVHDGVLPGQVNETIVRGLLCAAAFGHEYGEYLRQFLA